MILIEFFEHVTYPIGLLVLEKGKVENIAEIVITIFKKQFTHSHNFFSYYSIRWKKKIFVITLTLKLKWLICSTFIYQYYS